MSSVANAIALRLKGTTPAGVTTASLIVVLLVSVVIGALTGLLFDRLVNPLLVAIAAGLAGTVAAGVARNQLLARAWAAAGIEDTGTPIRVTVYAAVASLAGSLAAERLVRLLSEAPGLVVHAQVGDVPGIVLGAFAGLLSSVLFGLLIVTYRIMPDQRSRR
ncbi:MAG TPA: hypothetical protein VNJ31_08865 [Methyloceanibacter sp.]|nr:hypothetical protein [Methyloceanibacter sp.]